MPIAQYPAITGKNHKDETYKKFLQQDFSNNFGVDKKSMAGTFVNSAANNIYNLSQDQVLNNVIPYLEKELGGYTVFLTKAVVEGGGTSCNYLNHYSPSGMAGCQANYMDGLKVDVAMVKSTLNGHVAGPNGKETNEPLSVNLSSFESNYQVWPEDNPGSAEKMFKSMPKGSIGIHYMSMTHSGNGWVFQTSYAQQNWTGNPYSIGNAYDQFIKLVEDMGGNALDGKKGSGSNGSNGSNNSDDNNDGIFDNLPSNPLDAVKKAYESMLNYLDSLTQWDVHSIGSDKYFANGYFKLIKTYNNTYRIELTTSFYDGLKDIFSNLGNNDGSEKDDNDKGSNSGSSNDKGSGEDSKNGIDGINTCYLKPYRKLQQPYDPDGTNPNYDFGVHAGVDLRMDYETLLSPVSGTVRKAMNDPLPRWQGGQTGWGNHIIIKFGNQSVLFAHLDKINVSVGDKVKVGDKLGVTGATGDVFDHSGVTHGQHLHVELWNANDQTTDPTRWILDHCKKTKGQEPQYNNTTYQKNK